jgi:hypothetical protein
VLEEYKLISYDVVEKLKVLANPMFNNEMKNVFALADGFS